MFVMVSGECYEMEFENAGHIGNVSYDGAYYQFEVSSINHLFCPFVKCISSTLVLLVKHSLFLLFFVVLLVKQ